MRRAAGVLVVVVPLGVWGWWHYTFPYGWSHSCSKCLGMSLRLYAEDNNGLLPCGAATPEGSLSLLLKSDPSVKRALRGKNISQRTVDEAIARDGLLGPASCGWHYVEGLRESDDLQIAVVWDKAIGLSHNGERASGLMHEVVMLDGSMQYITRKHWPEFVEQQKRLLIAAMAERGTNDPPIRWSDEAALGVNVSKPRAKTNSQNMDGTSKAKDSI